MIHAIKVTITVYVFSMFCYSVWYLLQYYGEKKKMIPQIEEGISKCKWVDMASIESYRPKLRSYAKDVFEFLIIEKIKASSGKRIIS